MHFRTQVPHVFAAGPLLGAIPGDQILVHSGIHSFIHQLPVCGWILLQRLVLKEPTQFKTHITPS